MSGFAIKVENVSKKFELGVIGTSTFYHTLWYYLDKLKGGGKKKVDEANEFLALQDINFEVKHGEVVGIIGKNGAGKSTLLKVLSRITEPTTGRITVNGRIASLLEVGTGFHPELSGRENIFLNGSILGMTRVEIKRKFDEIVDFSGVEKFLDTPVKRYSSGMYVRLAFAVAAHLEPEILVVDEVLSVGDMEFQAKCIGKMGEVAQSGRTVLFVSHNMPAVKNLCSRCILLSSGRIIQEGSTTDIIERYMNPSNTRNDKGINLDILEKGKGKDVVLKDCEIIREDNHTKVLIQGMNRDKNLKMIGVGIKIKSQEGVVLTSISPKLTNFIIKFSSDNFRCAFVLPELDSILSSGKYFLDIWFSVPRLQILNYYDNIKQFEIKGKDIYNTGIIHTQKTHGYLPIKTEFKVYSN